MTRRPTDVGVAQDDDGTWRRREVKVVARHRVRVVSDRSTARPHQAGSGVEFELVVDASLELWVRRLGDAGPLRKDEEAGGVGLVAVENITLGLAHDVTRIRRPGDDQERWSCTCGAAGWWSTPEVCDRQVAAHLREGV